VGIAGLTAYTLLLSMPETSLTSRRLTMSGGCNSTLSDITLTVGMVARDPEIMGCIAGYSQAPLYAITGKAYANFCAGVLSLIWGPILASCCPTCFTRKRYNAFTGAEVVPGCEQLAQDDGQSQDYQFKLQPGHRISFEDDVHGVVTRIYNDDPDKALRIRLDNGISIGFNAAGEGFGLDLRDATYIETANSRFLSPFRMKDVSIAIQFVAILSSIFAGVTLWYSLPSESQTDLAVNAYLMLEHNSAVSLAVASSQTFVIGLNAKEARDRYIAWALFTMAAVAEVPLVVAAIWLGGKGIILFAILPMLPGATFIFIVLMALAAFLPSEAIIGTGSASNDEFGGKSRDEMNDKYLSKGILCKAWFLMIYVVPRNAQMDGYKFIIGVAYALVASFGIPVSWLLFGGLAAMPAAAAVVLEVLLPMFLILTLAIFKIVFGQGTNLGRSGFVMILGFIVALFVVNFFTLAVQASVLVMEDEVTFGMAEQQV